jgi:hypothetical protein
MVIEAQITEDSTRTIRKRTATTMTATINTKTLARRTDASMAENTRKSKRKGDISRLFD